MPFVRSTFPQLRPWAKTSSAKHLSTEEIRLARMWYDEDDKEPSEIAELLHRDNSTITRLLFQRPNEVERA